MDIDSNNGGEEILTFSALLAMLGRKSRQSVYDLMHRDPTFPKPRQIGSEFSVGWLRSEVMEWLRALPPVELNGLDAVQRRRRAQKLEAREGTSRRSRYRQPRRVVRGPQHLFVLFDDSLFGRQRWGQCSSGNWRAVAAAGSTHRNHQSLLLVGAREVR
jgi:predicted DNA-binding transcriptional regulator AlpA